MRLFTIKEVLSLSFRDIFILFLRCYKPWFYQSIFDRNVVWHIFVLEILVFKCFTSFLLHLFSSKKRVTKIYLIKPHKGEKRIIQMYICITSADFSLKSYTSLGVKVYSLHAVRNQFLYKYYEIAMITFCWDISFTSDFNEAYIQLSK